MKFKPQQLAIWILLISTACQADVTQPPPSPATAIPASPYPVTATSTPLPLPTDTATVTPTATIPPVINELSGATLPPGFSLIKFADLYRPTSFTFDSQGNLYVTSTDSTIYRLSDSNGDGRADSQIIFAAGYYLPLGITVRPGSGDVYVSHQGGITMLRDEDNDGRADTKKILVNDLPTDRHQNDNLKFGPDGWLYMGLGSTCDACAELNPKSATILQIGRAHV